MLHKGVGARKMSFIQPSCLVALSSREGSEGNFKFRERLVKKAANGTRGVACVREQLGSR